MPIVVDVDFRPFEPGVLGRSDGVRIWPDSTSNTWYPIALANKLAGRDLAPNSSDITVNFSSNVTNWYFGTDGSVAYAAGKYDFVSVVLHEIGHALGCVGLMSNVNGQGKWESGGPAA